MKFGPSTDLWVCRHQIAYPDLCEQCKKEKMSIKSEGFASDRLINGREVNLILAVGGEAGLHGNRLLEFIEFECGVTVTKLEDIRAGAQLQKIVEALRKDVD